MNTVLSKIKPIKNYIPTLVYLSIGTAFAFPLCLYFYNFNGALSSDHYLWAQFGSYVSGIYGALAFVILAYTTNITRKQFRIQNEDNIFFRLHESLQNRINSTTVNIDNEIITAHKAIKLVAYKFHEELSENSIHMARLLLCRQPENISDTHYLKIFQAIKGKDAIFTLKEDKESFISYLTEQADFESRWEKLKCHLGAIGEEGEKIRDALRATGSVNFYKIPFRYRRESYASVVQKLSDEYGEFLDGYYKNIVFLVQYAAGASNKETYMDFIRSQLSKYETIILFYLLAEKKEGAGSLVAFRDNNILDGLFRTDCQSLMIDFPSTKILKKEIEHIFN